MSRKLRELQYLVDGSDGFVYIIRKQSIVVDETCAEIVKGMDVTFLWPEESVRPKNYQGRILHCSTSESELQTLMKVLLKEREKKGKGKRPLLNTTEESSKDNKRTKAGLLKDTNSKETNEKSRTNTLERKKVANILAAKEILNDIKLSQTDLKCASTSIATPSQLKTLITNVETTLANAKGLVTSLDEIKSGLENYSAENIVPVPDLDEGSVNVAFDFSQRSPCSQRREDLFHHKWRPLKNQISPSSDDMDDPTIPMKNNQPSSPIFDRGEDASANGSESPSPSLKLHFSESDDSDVGTSRCSRPSSSYVSKGGGNANENGNSVAKRNSALSSLTFYRSASEESFDDEYETSKKETWKQENTILNEKNVIDDDNYDSEQEMINQITQNSQFDALAKHDSKEKNKNFKLGSAEPKNMSKTTIVSMEKTTINPSNEDNIENMAAQVYDDDSVWTLRYTSNEKGKTIELIKGTEIFAMKRVIMSILQGSKNQTGLARMLLDAVFTKQALIQCSLSGGAANGKGKHDAEKRLGLHKEAIATILNFTRQHAESKSWPPVDDRTIKASLRSKLTELRKQHSLNAK